MSIKKKIASILFGQKPEETEKEPPRPQVEQPEQEPSESTAFAQEDPSLIKLPGEHPLYQLYNQRRKEQGWLPTPRLCMDEDGTLPEELIRREKGRLESTLKNACNFRLRSAKSNGNKKKKEKKGEEEAEKETKSTGLDAFPWFFVSSDKLYAWVLVLPPTEQGKELSRNILLQAMEDQNITYGVDQRLVDRLSHDEARYFNLFLIAKGKPAFDGRNGNIVDYFPRVIERVLEVEDALLASVAGHVEFTGRSFQVKPVLDIDGDVDFSTGNIKFLGDVNIKGDVLTGFTVRAMGSIWVGGVIEAGSTVEAGGDLTVVKGILGDGTTTVRAQRCIFSKYIENATIYVRENLQTDAIINGSVYCDGEVLVRSGRGTIMGGRVWAAQKVSATAVGSKSECRTGITLGGLPCTNFERELVRRELKELEMELEKLECQLDSPVKASLISKVHVKLNAAELRLQQLEEDLVDSQEELKDREEGRLECSVAYAGTEITIEDETIRLRHEERQCVAKMVCGEIMVM